MIRPEQFLYRDQQHGDVGRVLVLPHLLYLTLHLERDVLVPVQRRVHLLDLPAVEDLLDDGGADVGGGPDAGGAEASDEDGSPGPGRGDGEDAAGDGEAAAYDAGAGADGPRHSAPGT